MVPKIAKRGASFKGAAAYYLHDKGAATNERVAFNLTLNLPVDEPELAWRWMAYTAKHAGILKDEAGVAATGRKLAKPVYTLSLSWSPEESPDRAEMVRAAQSALKALGLSKCQTLLVAHNDEPHPHIHALVNLVDPDTGKVRDPGLDKRKLSRWAEAYEREQGQIRCEQRVENNARRDRGEPANDRTSKTRQDIEQERAIEAAILAERRRSLWNRQVADREALKRQAEERAAAIRAELKERYRPAWAAFYRKQREDRRDADNARRSILAAMRVAIKERRRLTPEGRAGFGTVLAYALDARALGAALEQAEARELAALRQRMNDDRRTMVREVWQDHRRDFDKLKAEQAEARKAPPQLDQAAEEKRRAELAAEIARDREKEAAKPERPQRTGSYRGRDYSQIGKPAVPPPERAKDAPAISLEEQRRIQLKAEYRRQAEEISRRRKERSQKDRDRDRER